MPSVQRGTGPLNLGGKQQFPTLEEARQAAGMHPGAEAILKRQDGQFEVVALDDATAAQVGNLSRQANAAPTIAFADLPAVTGIEGGERTVAISLDKPGGSLMLNTTKALTDRVMGKAFETFQRSSNQEMEKTFRFAPEGSDKWKLFKAMELLAKLEHDSDSITDNEAKQVLTMRKAELEDTISRLNQKPEIKQAFANIHQQALRNAGVSQADLAQHANYLLSKDFKTKLNGLNEAGQKALLQHELSKLAFFDPEYATVVAGDLGASSIVEEGLEQLRQLKGPERDKVKVSVDFLIDDLMKDGNSLAGNAFKPLRELHKVWTSLSPAQVNQFRGVLADLAVNIEAMDAKEIEKAIKQVEGLPPDVQEQLSKLDWHGSLRKTLSTVAAIGTLISIGRSAEELHAKGFTFKTGLDLVKNSISFVGASKDIASTGGRVSEFVGMENMGTKLTSLGKTLDGFRVVKWAGPLASAISGSWDIYETFHKIENEDKAGAWLKGIGGVSGLVAAGAGGVAVWAGAGTTAAAIAGPIGLAAVAIGAAAAITYGFVAESEETGQFRKELRAIGITDEEEPLEQDFQKVVGQYSGRPDQQLPKALAWASSKSLPEQGKLINALMDQATNGVEEGVIFGLLRQSVGKNKDATGLDDFDRLIARTDPRRVAIELDNGPNKFLLDTLKARLPHSRPALDALLTGLCDGHRLDYLQQSRGVPQDFVKNAAPAAVKDMAQALMKGITIGKTETFLGRLVVDQPPERLAEILGRGGEKFIKDLVGELPQPDAQKLFGRFVDIARAAAQAEQDLKTARACGQPTEALELRAQTLKQALGTPLNTFAKTLGENANSWFYHYNRIMNETLSPELTQMLTPETLSTIASHLMDSNFFPPEQSSAALVKMIGQTSPEQLRQLLDNSSDTFIRTVLGGKVDNAQAEALLRRFAADGQPGRGFETLAMGLADSGHGETVKRYLQANPALNKTHNPVIEILASDKTAATLAHLDRDRAKLAALSTEEKAIVIRYLMEGWTTDRTETQIKNLLTDTHAQNPAAFKQLVSMVDAYRLANELDGDESREMLELIAKDGRPADFEAYATRLGSDDNHDVLFRFTAKPENLGQIGRLPARAIKEMAEKMMKGWTGAEAETVIARLLTHSSDQAFLDLLKDKEFAHWVAQELRTSDNTWFGLTGEADQIKTIMTRLGRMASEAENAANGHAPKQPRSELRLKQRADIAAALNSFGLGVAQQDYGSVLLGLASQPDTEAAVRMLTPPVLKAMTEQLMAGFTGDTSEKAIFTLLKKTTPDQLRKLLDKDCGGKAYVSQLGDELQGGQLRALMEKMISDKSINAGMGFSYLASKLAEEHHGETLRDLIGDRPSIVQQIHPTVLQDVCMKLSIGWTSHESQQAIAGILTHATPAQLEQLMQSDKKGDTHYVSDYLVYTLSADQAGKVLGNFLQTNDAKGKGLEAFLDSLARKQPEVLTQASLETLRKLGPDALHKALESGIGAWKSSTFGGSNQAAVQRLLDATNDSRLSTAVGQQDLGSLGKILAGDAQRFSRVLSTLGQDSAEHLRALTADVPVATLEAALSKIDANRLGPAAREVLFEHFVNEGRFAPAKAMFDGASTQTRAMMATYAAKNATRFSSASEAGKAAAWVLAYGNQNDVDTCFAKISGKWFGKGGEIVKAALTQAKADKLDVQGKLSLNALKSMMGSLNTAWTKMFGDYSENLRYVRELANLTDTEGKIAIVDDLMSGWTPGEAETLIHNVYRDTTDRTAFTRLVDRIGPARISSELENRQELGRVMAFILERYQGNPDTALNGIMNQWSSMSIQSDDIIQAMIEQLGGGAGILDARLNRAQAQSQLRRLPNSTLDKMIDWSDDAFRDGNVWNLDPETQKSLDVLKASKH